MTEDRKFVKRIQRCSQCPNCVLEILQGREQDMCLATERWRRRNGAETPDIPEYCPLEEWEG
jgi:hypothetical protein